LVTLTVGLVTALSTGLPPVSDAAIRIHGRGSDLVRDLTDQRLHNALLQFLNLRGTCVERHHLHRSHLMRVPEARRRALDGLDAMVAGDVRVG